MRKRFFITAALASLLAVSCIDNIEPETQTMEITTGLYIVNQGNYGSNDASLTYYNTVDGIAVPNCFERINGQRLGDCVQDAVVYGDRLYISVYNSGVIFAVNKYSCAIEGIVRATSPEGSGTLSPRYMTTYGGKVLATYYEGYVGAIDTASLSVTSIQKVGPNPEELTVCGEKLYVANSGGLNYPDYDNTVSVLNAASLAPVATIEVAPNPSHLVSNELGDVYLISLGNYADVPAVLQKINTGNNTVETVNEVKNPMAMTSLGNILYILTSYYDENWTAHSGAVSYDTSTRQLNGQFILDGTIVNNMYSISVDKDTKVIYIGASDYISNGFVYAFSTSGNLVQEIDANGLNPCKVVPVRAVVTY